MSSLGSMYQKCPEKLKKNSVMEFNVQGPNPWILLKLIWCIDLRTKWRVIVPSTKLDCVRGSQVCLKLWSESLHNWRSSRRSVDRVSSVHKNQWPDPNQSFILKLNHSSTLHIFLNSLPNISLPLFPSFSINSYNLTLPFSSKPHCSQTLRNPKTLTPHFLLRLLCVFSCRCSKEGTQVGVAISPTHSIHYNLNTFHFLLLNEF